MKILNVKETKKIQIYKDKRWKKNYSDQKW